jgi:hypothetical protein
MALFFFSERKHEFYLSSKLVFFPFLNIVPTYRLKFVIFNNQKSFLGNIEFQKFEECDEEELTLFFHRLLLIVRRGAIIGFLNFFCLLRLGGF